MAGLALLIVGGLVLGLYGLAILTLGRLFGAAPSRGDQVTVLVPGGVVVLVAIVGLVAFGKRRRG